LGYFISAWIASQGVRNSSDADDHLGAGSIKLRASGRLDDFREKITFYNKQIDLDVRLGDLAPALLALGAALAGCVSEWDQLSLAGRLHVRCLPLFATGLSAMAILG
jgi:hypothetical protein